MTSRLEFRNQDYPVALIRAVCALAGNPTYIDDLERTLRSRGIVKAVADHDTPKLFEWLVEEMSYQGIANGIAADYMQRHGRATWRAVQAGLAKSPSCPKLGSYWQFHGCRYHKGSRTCAEPEHIETCPLPSLALRNGNLNQLAYSLFLFIRDLMDGDLVAWLDKRLADADHGSRQLGIAAMREAVLGSLRQVYGVSDKVLSVALSSLLLGGGRGRARWAEVGGSLIAIDTLVHNFLARTRILARANAGHPYGPACYRAGGCAPIIEGLARAIDAREFNPSFPPIFPRFVQHAIWRYCAAQAFDVCNGNRIDDSQPCRNAYCRLFRVCDRLALYGQTANVA
jgi:hypothetical protein